jgi:integrase
VGTLTWTQVKAFTKPGLYSDGNGLYLQVTSETAKSWILRYQRHGRRRDMGLGSVDDVSLAAAREFAQNARKQIAAGLDPIEARDTARIAQRLQEAQAITFRQAAEDFINSHEPGWKNAKHRWQWRSTLKAHAYPVLGTLPVGSIDTALILKVLNPIWSKMPETASRLRGRIERILAAAKVNAQRQGENPAQWRGHLDQLLPAPTTLRSVRHHPALPYTEVPALMTKLQALKSVSSRALELTILTAVRTTETRAALWPEFQLDTKTWTIPKERMKAHHTHRVPLCDRAVAIIKEMQQTRISKYVFPGGRAQEPLSNMAQLECLRGLKSGYTVHGFRSSFRDWAGEETNHPHDICEAALAHTRGDKVHASYQRGDLFKKRRVLMDAWAAFCLGAPAPTASTPQDSSSETPLPPPS